METFVDDECYDHGGIHNSLPVDVLKVDFDHGPEGLEEVRDALTERTLNHGQIPLVLEVVKVVAGVFICVDAGRCRIWGGVGGGRSLVGFGS